MNYIREELLKQQLLWADLSGIGEAPEEEERMEEQLLGQGPERYRENHGNNGVAETEAESRMGDDPKTAEVEFFVGTALSGGENAVAWRVQGRYREADPAEASTQMIFAGDPGAERFFVDVKRISRSIQRDARRYDGGFSMY